MDFDEYSAGTNETNVYSSAIDDMLAPINKVLDIAGKGHVVPQDAILDASFAYANIEDILNLCYVVLGLAGEAGEIAEKTKKTIRDRGGDIPYEDLKDEAGDSLYYLAQLSENIGYPLRVVAERNSEKLKSRKERNALKGDGDNR